MLSKNINGLAVVHIDAGQRLGTIRGVLLDPAKRRATALLVGLTQGWMRKGLLAIEHIYAIGDQAVTVEDEAHLVTPDEESALWSSWKDRVDLHGMPILTERGEGLGIVDAYDFDLNGRITEIAIRQGVWRRFKGQTLTLPGISIRSFGRDAVIVRAEFAAEIQAQQTAAKPSDVDVEEDTYLAKDIDKVNDIKAADSTSNTEDDASLPARLWQRVRQIGVSKIEEKPLASESLDPMLDRDDTEEGSQTSHEEQLRSKNPRATEGEG